MKLNIQLFATEISTAPTSVTLGNKIQINISTDIPILRYQITLMFYVYDSKTDPVVIDTSDYITGISYDYTVKENIFDVLQETTGTLMILGMVEDRQGEFIEYTNTINLVLTVPKLPTKLVNVNSTVSALAIGGKSTADPDEELFENYMDSKFYKDIEVNGDLSVSNNINTNNITANNNITASGNIKGFINTTIKTLPSGTDGRDYWNYLPNGTYWYANSGSPANMPSSWGWVIKTGFEGTGDFNVIYYPQASGNPYRKSGNANSVTDWEKIPLMKNINPVGSVFTTATNTNPNSLGIPGTWTLIDKEFTPILNASGGATLYSTNTTSIAPSFSRSGHTINFTVAWGNKVNLGSSNLQIWTMDFATLGVSNLGCVNRGVGWTEAGDCAVFLAIDHNTGKAVHYHTIPDSYVSAGRTLYYSCSFTIPMSAMLDSACNKFYWKRTA